MGSWKKRIIKQLINFAFLSIKLSFLELSLLIITAKFPAHNHLPVMAVKWCAQLKEMCAVSPSCAVGVYHLVVWSPRPDQRSPFKAFAEDVKRNKPPSQRLSACAATIRKPAATSIALVVSADTWQEWAFLGGALVGLFYILLSFLKVRTLPLPCSVTFTTGSYLWCFLSHSEPCAVFTSLVKFQEWAFLLEICKQKGR